MKAIVTGATGSIGADLIDLHIDLGDEVIAIVNPQSKRISNISDSGAEVMKCDISDYGSLDDMQCDVFYHLAWSGTHYGKRDDIKEQESNVKYSLDAVDLAHRCGARKFVGTGSQAEYGLLDSQITKDTHTNPITAYGISKLKAGIACSERCRQLGMGFNWARILSVFGRFDDGNALVPYLIRCFKNGTMPEMTSCEQTWDLLYSKDCARALYMIAEKGLDGKTYCIASGAPTVLKEYVERIRDVISPAAEIGFGMKQDYTGQTRYLSADISELTADTGFIPRYSVEDGIRDMLD